MKSFRELKKIKNWSIKVLILIKYSLFQTQEVVIEDEFLLNTLNSLSFPDEFLWSNASTVSVVQGEKTFTSTLSTNVMDVEGLLNGLNTSDAITLRGDQEWRGLPTFTELKVTELFQVI